MKRRTIESICLAFCLVANQALLPASAQNLPSPTQFQQMLTTCAAGNSINLSADLRGSLTSLYEKDRTQGTATMNNVTQFLGSLPEKDRLEGYRLYTSCIKDFVSRPGPPPASYAPS